MLVWLWPSHSRNSSVIASRRSLWGIPCDAGLAPPSHGARDQWLAPFALQECFDKSLVVSPGAASARISGSSGLGWHGQIKRRLGLPWRIQPPFPWMSFQSLPHASHRKTLIVSAVDGQTIRSSARPDEGACACLSGLVWTPASLEDYAPRSAQNETRMPAGQAAGEEPARYRASPLGNQACGVLPRLLPQPAAQRTTLPRLPSDVLPARRSPGRFELAAAPNLQLAQTNVAELGGNVKPMATTFTSRGSRSGSGRASATPHPASLHLQLEQATR